MAYGRRRATRRRGTRTYSRRRTSGTTYRRRAVRRSVSSGRVRKSRTARPREQVVRIVVQNTSAPEAGFASNNALAALGITPATAKEKKARIGSN